MKMLLLQFLYNKKDHGKGGLFKMRKVGIVGKNKLFSRRKTEKLCDSLFEDYEKSRKDKVWLDC